MATEDIVCYGVEGDDLVEVTTPARTLDELSRELPRGVYAAMRTYPGGRALHVSDHLRRLQQSAGLLGHPMTCDLADLRRAMAQALQRSGFDMARLRVIVAFEPPGAVFVALAPFADIPEEVYRRGAHAVTAHMAREMPLAKATQFIEQRDHLREGIPSGVEEIVLVGPDDAILEGTSSNFFAVLDGWLRTADQGVLVGITRTLVLDIARELLPIGLHAVTLTELSTVSEAFITSSSRGVLPLATIDGRPVRSGEPGPITVELRQRYVGRVEQDLEPLAG